MPLFKPKPPISQDELDWLLACFAWLRKVLDDADIRPDLVTPLHPKLASTNTAQEMFDAVRDLMDMAEWQCRLERIEARQDIPELGLIEGDGACGTFSIENGEFVIRYNTSMLKNPDALAATFAHELCHFLLVEAGDPPGGPDLMEHATDCAAAYLGFGVLLANSARTFENWSSGGMSGWRSSMSGYLSEQALVTAAALFAALHDHSSEDAVGALKPYLRKDFAKAQKAVAFQYPDMVMALADVDLQEWKFD